MTPLEELDKGIDLKDMPYEELLQHFVELVQWHTRREYARDTDPNTNAQRAAFWAAEKELLERLRRTR